MDEYNGKDNTKRYFPDAKRTIILLYCFDMILLNSAICSKNFRKVGIIHASINLFLQSVLLIALIITLAMLERGDIIEEYADDYGFHIVNNTRYYILTNIFMVGIYLTVLFIILHSMLIHGLIGRTPALLTVWLCFAVFEFIFFQLFLSLLSAYSNVIPLRGIGILFVTIQIIIAIYMVYNMSVVYSARSEFIQSKKLNKRFSVHSPENNTPRKFNTTAPPQTPHTQYAFQRPDYNSTLDEVMPSNSSFVAPNHRQTMPNNQQFMYSFRK